jgi:translation initiation factor IF-3
VRVIDSDGEQLGVMAIDKAVELAEAKGLDLVEVSPTAAPPVCRIIDYGKYKYEKNKRLKQSKKKQHTIQLKEIKLRPKTEEHDYQFKKRHAEEFLGKSFKVKFTIIFRGRELDHKDMGVRILNRIKEDLAHVGVVERDAQFEGRLMTMYMGPLPQQQAKQSVAAETREGKDAETQVE